MLSSLITLTYLEKQINHKVAGWLLQPYRLNSSWFFFLPTFLCELLLQSCEFDCRWLLMPDCDGALFVSWMCNLPSSCLWLPTEKGLLVLCLPWQSHWLLPSPSPLCTLTYSCPTGCSERDRHPWASEGRRALLLLSQIQLTGSSHSRWAVEIKPPGTWQPLWASHCEI